MGMPSLSSSSGPSRIDAALGIIRIACALTFLYHGSGILFGAFGGPGPAGFSGYLHMPVFVGYLVGLAQFGGGMAMLTGIFIRIGALGIILVMLGAIFMVHLPHGFDIGKNGCEYALTELLIAGAILFSGGGAYSLSAWLPAPLRSL